MKFSKQCVFLVATMIVLESMAFAETSGLNDGLSQLARSEIQMTTEADDSDSIENTSNLLNGSEVIVGEDADSYSEKIGYIHPLITVEGKYTDNLYRLNDEKTDDFITIISPGVWLAAPRSRERILNINPSNSRPGGLMTSLETETSFQRYQTYLLYEADIYSYATESDNNFVGHTVEGFLQYNFPFGLTLEGADQFRRSFDSFGLDGSGPGQLNEYNANVFLVSFKYPLGGSFRLRGDYTNFSLQYDEGRKSFSDRTDNKYDFYLWYDYSEKTAFFINGEYVRLGFDNTSYKDSDQYDATFGVRWLPSDKTRLRVKAGYVRRDFDNDALTDGDGVSFEMKGLYRFTVKTSLELTAASFLNVPNELDYDYRRDNILLLDYRQNIRDNILFAISGRAGILSYKGNLVDDRDDDLYKINPYVRYDIKDWLTTRLDYSYEKRQSDLERYDYEVNVVSLKLQASF